MICHQCRIAGDVNTQGIWLLEHDRPSEAEIAFNQATVEHAKCEHPDCPCQHATGQRLHA